METYLMKRKLHHPPSRLAALAMVAGAALLLATTGEARGGEHEHDNVCEGFQDVEGPFSSVVGPPCASPIGLCTHGQLHGDLEAQYDFTFATLTPTGPGAFVYTGTSVITSAHGAMFSQDHGVLQFVGPNVAAFTTYVVVVSGDGRYTGATGALAATGTVDFATGRATGSYTGGICRGDRDGHDD